MYESLSFSLREAAAAPPSYAQRDGATKYVRLAAVPSPAGAAAYSVDSMTTRRASELVLDRHLRMRGATEAGDGTLLFGIGTAFLFYVMLRLWKSDAQSAG